MKEDVSAGVCAGHIIGIELGIILICVAVFLFLVKWKKSKWIVFVTCLLIGCILIIGLCVNYGELRRHKLGKTCDSVFIAFGVIDVLLVACIVVLSVKMSGGEYSNFTSDSKH